MNMALPFRAFNNATGGYHPLNNLHWVGGKAFLSRKEIFKEVMEPATIQAFTGVYESSSESRARDFQPIYVGDIVELRRTDSMGYSGHYKGVVTLLEGGFWIDYEASAISLWDNDLDELEVVGNVLRQAFVKNLGGR